MDKKPLFVASFAFLGGVYSGTLAYTKLTTGICAFGASCPFLFGLPVCVYGFAGFSIVFLLATIAYVKSNLKIKAMNFIYWFSLIGVFFALYYLIQEVFLLPAPLAGRVISLGYPSCLYGLMGYALIFAMARSITMTQNFGK